MRTEALRMENISMEFSGVYVLSDMQLQVGQGSIHALVRRKWGRKINAY